LLIVCIGIAGMAKLLSLINGQHEPCCRAKAKYQHYSPEESKSLGADERTEAVNLSAEQGQFSGVAARS